MILFEKFEDGVWEFPPGAQAPLICADCEGSGIESSDGGPARCAQCNSALREHTAEGKCLFAPQSFADFTGPSCRRCCNGIALPAHTVEPHWAALPVFMRLRKSFERPPLTEFCQEIRLLVRGGYYKVEGTLPVTEDLLRAWQAQRDDLLPTDALRADLFERRMVFLLPDLERRPLPNQHGNVRYKR